MIDKNKIFGLFDNNNKKDSKELINSPEDILEEGYAKIGMFRYMTR